jgi:hypothetical protein
MHNRPMAMTNPVSDALATAALLRQQNAALWQQNATLLLAQQQSDQHNQLLFGPSWYATAMPSSSPLWSTSTYTVPAAAAPRLSLGSNNVWTVNVPTMLLPTSGGAPQPVLVHCGVTSASITPPRLQPPSLLDPSPSSSLFWSSALNAAIQSRQAACTTTITRLDPVLGSGAATVRYPRNSETESTMAALLRYQQTMAAATAVFDVNGRTSSAPSS